MKINTTNLISLDTDSYYSDFSHGFTCVVSFHSRYVSFHSSCLFTKRLVSKRHSEKDRLFTIIKCNVHRGVFNCNPCNPCNPWKSGKNGKNVEILRVFEFFEHSATPETPLTPFSTPANFRTIRPWPRFYQSADNYSSQRKNH